VQVFHIVPEPGAECCDFCTARPVFKTYACHNFMWNKQTVFAHESIGAWAACIRCAVLIDAGRWAELTARAFRKFCKRHKVARYDRLYIWEQFRGIHKLFREHMIEEV
jgi:hypothetical protein